MHKTLNLLIAALLLGLAGPLFAWQSVDLSSRYGAFSFNGTNQMLDLGNSPILQVSAHDFTVQAWVRFRSTSRGGPPCYSPGCDMSIVEKMTSSPGGDPNANGWRLLKQSDNRFWFCFGTGSNGCWSGAPTTVTSDTVAQAGRWYFVVARKRAMTISIFINGRFERSSEMGSFVDTNASSLHIGGNQNEGAYLNGDIDTIKIARWAQPDQDIAAAYRGSSSAHQPHHRPADEGPR